MGIKRYQKMDGKTGVAVAVGVALTVGVAAVFLWLFLASSPLYRASHQVPPCPLGFTSTYDIPYSFAPDLMRFISRVDASRGIKDPGQFCFSEKPLLEKPIKFVYVFTPMYDRSSQEISLYFSEHFEILEGQSINRIVAKAGKTEQIELLIKATKIGYATIRGRAGSHFFVFPIEITSKDAIIGNGFENRWGANWFVDGKPNANDELIFSALVVSETPALGQEFVITYSVTSGVYLQNTEKELRYPQSREEEAEVRQQTSLAVALPLYGLQVTQIEFPPGGTNYAFINENGFTKKLNFTERVVGSDKTALVERVVWIGGLEKNRAVELRLTVKPVAEGRGDLMGRLEVSPGANVEKFIRQSANIGIWVNKYEGSASSLQINGADRESLDPQGRLRADLVISLSAYAPDTPLVGDIMTFSARVKNIGLAVSNTIRPPALALLRLDIGDDGKWDIIGPYASQDELHPEAIQIVEWQNLWRAFSGKHSVEVCADATEIISESNETNNCSRIKFTVK